MMEITDIEFARNKPHGSGACNSVEEREAEIGAFLDTIKWVHPGHFVSRRAELDSAEAVVIVRRPAASTASTMERWVNFRSWLQKKLPKFFDGSLCSFERRFEWSAYKIHSKIELTVFYSVDDANFLMNQGFDVEVVQPKVARLHRLNLPDPRGIIYPSPKKWNDFLPVQAHVTHFALNH